MNTVERFQLGRELKTLSGEHDGWLIEEQGVHPQYWMTLKIKSPYNLARRDLALAAIDGMNRAEAHEHN